MAGSAKDALAEGLADAIGFAGGGLAGWQLGRLFGFDALASGDTTANVLGWLFLLAGLTAGKWASRQWRLRRTPSKD